MRIEGRRGYILTISLLQQLRGVIERAPFAGDVYLGLLYKRKQQVSRYEDMDSRRTDPFYIRIQQCQNSLGNISPTSPALRFIARPTHSIRPAHRINRKLPRDPLHIRLLLWHKVLHEPAEVDKGPFQIRWRCCSEDISQGCAGMSVRTEEMGERFDITGPFGGDEAFAGPGI